MQKIQVYSYLFMGLPEVSDRVPRHRCNVSQVFFLLMLMCRFLSNEPLIPSIPSGTRILDLITSWKLFSNGVSNSGFVFPCDSFVFGVPARVHEVKVKS